MCEQFGRHLRTARIRLGFSQQELADRSGLSRAILSRMEKGRSEPLLPTLRRLATALDMSPAALLEGLETRPPAQLDN
jgi:transcriptional regulator with XRE-family HTH domain